MASSSRRLPPEVNRIVFCRNIPYNVTNDQMYEVFGKYGAIRQIRIGDQKSTKGTAFVVYEDIMDAKTAVDHLSGFNFGGRYLVVLYYNQHQASKMNQKRKREELDNLKRRHNITLGMES
jgi:pre-mRNA branch site protein p14